MYLIWKMGGKGPEAQIWHPAMRDALKERKADKDVLKEHKIAHDYIGMSLNDLMKLYPYEG